MFRALEPSTDTLYFFIPHYPTNSAPTDIVNIVTNILWSLQTVVNKNNFDGCKGKMLYSCLLDNSKYGFSGDQRRT